MKDFINKIAKVFLLLIGVPLLLFASEDFSFLAIILVIPFECLVIDGGKPKLHTFLKVGGISVAIYAIFIFILVMAKKGSHIHDMEDYVFYTVKGVILDNKNDCAENIPVFIQNCSLSKDGTNLSIYITFKPFATDMVDTLDRLKKAKKISEDTVEINENMLEFQKKYLK